MPARLTIDQVKEKLFKVHGNVITLDGSTYKNTHTKCRFIDKDFGSWFAVPNNVLGGHGHSKRGNNEVRINTCLKKYGTKHHLQNKSIFAKQQQTNLESYGVKNISELESTKERVKQTNLENYDVTCVFKSPKIKEKIKKANLEKYGVEYISQSAGVQEKIKKTNLDKYGVERASQSAEIQEKIKNTNMERYGFDYATQSECIKEKTKKTNIERYGVEYTSQNRTLALKMARGANSSKILYHWKSKQEIVCVGSYEVRVIEYLNLNHTEYSWQPKVFIMPPGLNGKQKTYRPDLYLENENKWIEIKGYFRKDAREKWEWFTSQHTNSELWDKAKLKEMKII